jgi:polyketide synthase PksL
MTDFIEYVVSELKSRRLSKENALNLIRQFSQHLTSGGKSSIIHPLLHRNISDIHQQCYRSSFNGDEFFLRDHQVVADGSDPLSVLPGVAYLEMARAAVADALPDESSADQIVLNDVVWIKPIVVADRKDVFIALSGGGSDRPDALAIEFEIFSEESAGEGAMEEVVHCRGAATFAGREAPERLDIEALQKRMAAGQIDASVVYPAYRKMGMKFGPAHQAVSRVFRGEKELVARLTLPSAVSGTLEQYQLHPSLMDGALQAAIGLLGDLQRLPGQPSLPFALESLRAFSGCKQNMVAWIRHAKDSIPNDKVTKLDIDLCDDQGKVCVQFRGFSSRILSVSPDLRRPPQSEQIGLVLANPVWQPSEIENASAASAAQHHVLWCELPGVSAVRVQELMPNVRFHEVSAKSAGMAQRFLETAVSCFEAVRKIIEAKTGAGVFIHIAVPDELDANLLVGLSGLLKSAALENPGVKGQLLLVDGCAASDQLPARLRAESGQAKDAIVRYREGVRQVLAWQELHETCAAPEIAFKEGGVYLITGGLGELGTLFAKEILRQTVHAKVVLTGRAELSESVREKLKALAAGDAAQRRIEYRALDLTDPAQVRQLVADIKATHRQLNGIIHSAGMIADNFIANKTPEEFAQVLAPKVFGAVNLDLASHDLDLDFLVLFSSGASIMGNVGQSDYAVANGFLDQFADHRNRLVASGRRKGTTLAINWPLWQDGGMRMSQHDQDAMRETTGMHAMQTHTGIRAFYRCLEALQQTVVIEGRLEKIRRMLFDEYKGQSESAPQDAAPAPGGAGEKPSGDLPEQTRDYLRKQFAALFKLPYSKVDPRAPLEKYGIDSILAMDLTRQLEKTFGTLPKTLFFEHQTIDELTDYFLRSYPSKLETIFKVTAQAQVQVASSKSSADVPSQSALPVARTSATRRHRREHAPAAATPIFIARHDEPIAIVGLSGRYPESADIEAFWENLRDGKDCIVEVPKDRWDWREYYSEDRTAEGCHYSKWGGFITGVDEFDPLFFNIPPAGAELIDPQERLFLQHAWMAIEDAGVTRAGLQAAHQEGQAGQVGVYVGVMYGEYQLFGAESSLQGTRIGIPVSYASIANRVSYVLNLHGPSMTLDTMCSSSLTAIHLACQDLKLGRTSLAIAGGVNVTIHPNKYLILSAGQFISGDGHCQSFGEGGDGYIPGEGVGAVVLKRLSEAEKDGNHIYGVIKGSALNHGGKTNGYSVPNPKAQAGVIGLALKEYGVDARHVSYIEAHGTGTKLGDPIEIAALTQVFRQYSKERQFCAIGSAKSNIGHCESAAGIAGLTKVLLQMKNRMIVPSLHSAVLNPYIDFEASPFVVNQTLRAWEQPEVDGKRVPRIAGISAFGAGGSNAHLIVEEYPADGGTRPGNETESPHGRVIIALSARTNGQLKRKVEDLLGFVTRQEHAIDLHAMAYTLQVGREAMDVRLAFVVGSIAQLAQQLASFGRDEQGIDQCFQGKVEQDADSMSVLSQDDDMAEAIDKWIARKKLAKLADLWVKGLELDWRKLHTERQASLISLPTYPFAADRYWVARAVSRSDGSTVAGTGAPALHPLLHTNTSDFFQQSYVSQFTGQEFFLADHQIGAEGASQQKILPGVVYLEMVRAAVDLALPVSAGPRRLEIRNVAWAQAIAVNASKRVSIALWTNGDSIVDFEVQTCEDEARDPLIHCQGQVEVASAARQDRPGRDRLDIDGLKTQMTDGAMAPDRIYRAFKAMGIHYGPSFRCVAAIHRGHGQVLAELILPAGPDINDYVLHPGMLDSALQASIGLVADLDNLPDQPSVPFALDSIVLAAPCAARMFAWVRYAEDAEGGQAGNGISKINIDLCDEDGNLCARLTGLASRTLPARAEQDGIGMLIACPSWEPVAAAGASSGERGGYRRHRVLLCDLPRLDLDRLQADGLGLDAPGIEAKQLAVAGAENVADRYRIAALACFEELQAILKNAPQEKTLFQLVVADEGDDALLAGLSGLIDTARLENPNLVGQIVLTERNIDATTLAGQLRSSAARSGDTLFKHVQDGQSVLRWKPQEVRGAASVAFRNQGVYLITGGLGGLGVLFAREILGRTEGAVVVLTGRTDLNSEKCAALEQLATQLSIPAGRLVYRTLDLNRLDQVAALVAGIALEFGAINGVIHSAGMNRDSFIINKTSAEFAQVLEPKVVGTANLDSATQHTDLDFMVLFSSVAAALGNLGQADYAAANGFMDQFAAYRNRLVGAERRRGKTLSINWPLWQEGGMQLDAETSAMLTQASGMLPLKTASGMQAFYRGLELDCGRALVIEGHLDRLRRSLQDRHAPVVAEQPAAGAVAGTAQVDTTELQERATSYLSNQFSILLKVPAHEVDARAPMEKYGMDSILAMKLTNQLERTFGSLSKTLFFEYQTIASLAAYLVKAFPDILREKTGAEAGAGPRREAPPQAPASYRAAPSIRGKVRFAEPAAKGGAEVAIVGLGGRYPMAKDLREFWENLKSGRDCITEIPQERWDHTPFYDPARNRPGKTYSKWGGFLSGVDQFDALFFNISPKEAELIDPQERLFIETVWETIEDAGYSKDAIARNRVGVYVGVMWGQYELYGAMGAGAGAPSSSFASIANRVSYFFNFQGPSLALDTMCSSSLTAIHLASEDLRRGTIDVAIAGGVNLSIHPSKYLSLSQGNFASSDGRCRSFGEGGDGYVPGEGVGAVLLKPLEQAVRDGDQIYAVVKASSINHGGKTNGYTVPNPIAQADLIRTVLDQASIDPATISYVETHGTGTSLGDPIEITGLVKGFEGAARHGRSREKQYCSIGSVKSNIGHLESAAGIAAVTKVLLQLKHQQLVPSLHAERLNPHIDFEDTPFYVQTSLEPWKRAQGQRRRVGVSGFGAGGSNAHLILEEFVDPREPAQRQDRPEAFVLSAKNRVALFAYAEKMIELLDQATDLSFADIAFTSQVGRTPMPERLVVIASDKSALKDKLLQWQGESKAGDPQTKRCAGLAIEDVYEGSTRDAQSGASALIDGAAGTAFLQLTLEQRDLVKLAQLWVGGVEIDWAVLYRAERPKRVSLPSYPFARDRYWIATRPAFGAEIVPEERKHMLYYRTEWAPAQPVAAREGRSAAGVLLVLGADDAWSDQFKRQADGVAVVAVQYGDGYRQLGPDQYCVDHLSESDFLLLIEDLKSKGRMPEAIVHCAGQNPDVRQQLDRGVFALHCLCKAVMKHKPKDEVRIVSWHQHGLPEHSALHRALAGYLKSLALENPKFSWKVVSLDGAPGAEEIAHALWDEVRDAGWRDSEVRYLYQPQGARLAGRRQVRQMERYAPRPIEKAGAAVKQNGVYIVTGGLGALGYIFSEHLARQYDAKLVLTGRSALDAGQQTKLAALKSHGADVIYVQADVSDPDQADALVCEAKRRFSRIDGVIHSAGVHRDSFALNKTREEMESVLAAKVMGTINLDRATRDEDLDLFVLFSSVAGALGNLGQCDYAFANNFLDGYAEQRQALVASGERSGKTLSINWPLWADGGMQISRSDIDLMERRSGNSPLPTEIGIRYWDTFLQSDDTQGIALYGDPSKIEAYLARSASEPTPRVAPEMRAADAPSLLAATENYLKTLLGQEIKLAVERIDAQERFEAFGVDSMMIGRINAELERDLGDLPKTLFYEYATIEELAGYLVQEAQPALVRRFEAPVPACASIAGNAASASASAIAIAGVPTRSPAQVAGKVAEKVAEKVLEKVAEKVAEKIEEDGAQEVAIIGVHGHFPGSGSLEQYWRNLREGRDLISLVPESRWDLHAFFDADPDHAKEGKIYCKWGGFLDDVDKFDAAFFSVAPEDARMIDPQERLFIQSVWAAVEDAGYTRDGLKKRYRKGKSADVGVFVGVTTNSYHMLAPEEWRRGNMVTPGSLPWSIANRVSYFFDFQGPSMPVDSACSSSLVAIHLACESLKRKECQVAVAGGVNLYLHPSKYLSLCRRRMLALDGKCRSFGDGDDGFIPGEGVGSFVLKPLARAIEERDHIYGVVKASAYQHSGRSNGYSAPNPNSQALLIEQTLNQAGISPESIGYVEGHGTGTQLGDNLEVVALTQAFRKGTQKKQYCSLGSVKANLGHSESAAGIAGVAKILLQFKHREIAPTIHSEPVNPNIDLENSPFYLQHALAPWNAPAGHPRRAMINSFGAGGVNSCLIIEQYERPESDPIAPGKGAYLVILSAKNAARLRESAARLCDHLKADDDLDLDIDLGRLSYTLQVGREAMDERLAVVVSTANELLIELSDYTAGVPSSKLAVGSLEPHRRKKSPNQDQRERAKSMFEGADLDTLALMWIEGHAIDWDDLYGADRPCRLPLPTYPFAGERFWVSDRVSDWPLPAQPMAAEPKLVQLHPLVSHNASTLKEVCFASSLSGKKYYGRDHQVNGELFFPGAGFLELACVSGTIAGEQSVSAIEDIVWIQPLTLTAGDTLVKTVLKSSGNNAQYAIVSFDDDNEPVLHSEGRVVYGNRSKHGDEVHAAYSIQELKNRAGRTVPGSHCYRQFEGFGLRYGPCFQTVEELYIGSSFALSKLRLADELKDDFEQYILHPCIIDGALQTVIGMTAGGEPDTPYLPFALDQVEILRPLSETCYAYVEQTVAEDSAKSDIKQFNIRLLNESGAVLVRLNNFCVRALRGAQSGQRDQTADLLSIE